MKDIDMLRSLLGKRAGEIRARGGVCTGLSSGSAVPDKNIQIRHEANAILML